MKTKNNPSALSALLGYPFETGLLPWPTKETQTLIWGAQYWTGAEKMGDVRVVQPFYPDTLGWQAQAIDVHPEIVNDKPYQAVFLCLPKQKEAVFYQLAVSLDNLQDNGLLMAVAANDTGGKRLEKWFQDFGLSPSSVSKSKCRIVWAFRQNPHEDVIQNHIKAGTRQHVTLENGTFTTQPGIFGWNKIDQGSKCLTSFIPNDLYGYGADFGAGYGYLSRYVLDHCPKIKDLNVVEADYNALQCAKENLKDDKVDFQWADLTKAIKFNRLLDFIVMNPPFHEGKKADHTIGQKFIENAAQALKKNGALYMVANAHLPYESHLQNLFSKIDKLDENQGFKIYRAYK